MPIHFPSPTGLSTARPAPSRAWPGGAAAFEISPASLLDAHPGQPLILAMDLEGRGRADLVQIWSSPCGELHATTYLAVPGAAGVAYQRAADTLLGSFGCQAEVLQGDLDGDGRADLIVAYAGGPGRELRLAAFLGNGSGFIAAGDFATGAAFSLRHIAFFVLDTTGDGRADVVEALEGARGLLTFRIFRSHFGDGRETFGEALLGRTAGAGRPAGEILFFGPLGGVAAADLVRVRRRACDDHVIAETYLADPGPSERDPYATLMASDLGAFPQANQQTFFAADVDGDGQADLVQAFTTFSESGARLHLQTFFGRGAGIFVAGPESVFAKAAPSLWHLLGARPGGSPTLLGRWIGASGRQMFATYRGSPNGFFRQAFPSDAGPAVPGAASSLFLAGDADGDGQDDLLRLRLDAGDRVEVVPYLFSAAFSGARPEPPAVLRGNFRVPRPESAAGG